MSHRSQQNIIYLLVLLIGILIGIVIVQYEKLNRVFTPTRLNVTEVKKLIRDTDEDYLFRPSSENFKSIAALVTPSVVFIETSVNLRSTGVPDDGNHNFGDEFWDRFMPNRRVQTSGSGIIISEDGFIVTNNHVINGAERGLVNVELSDRRRFDAEIIGGDASTDIAVIKIQADNLEPVVIGDSDDVEVGDWVLAIGNPFRLRSTVTAGIVSALGRDVDIIREGLRIENFIQTDAAINRGNSGGALVDLKGSLVGVNTAIASETGTYEGYGFAVPINMAMKIAADIMEFGEVKRALLGVEIVTVDYQRAEDAGLPAVVGVEIVTVVKNGAAWNAGIRGGDIILAVDGKPVNASNALQASLIERRPGEQVNLSLWRDDQVVDVLATLMGSDSESFQRWLARADAQPGFSPDVEEVITKEFDPGFSAGELLDASNGQTVIVITAIRENSEAWKKGLRVGDQIVAIDDENIHSLDQLGEYLKTVQPSSALAKFEVRKAEGSIAYYYIQP